MLKTVNPCVNDRPVSSSVSHCPRPIAKCVADHRNATTYVPKILNVLVGIVPNATQSATNPNARWNAANRNHSVSRNVIRPAAAGTAQNPEVVGVHHPTVHSSETTRVRSTLVANPLYLTPCCNSNRNKPMNIHNIQLWNHGLNKYDGCVLI